MLPKVAEVLGKVCALARGVFGKRLNKICDIPCVVCFMLKGGYFLDRTRVLKFCTTKNILES